MMKDLAQQGLNLDNPFVLMRSAKTDGRDGRPRDIAGRILISNNLRESTFPTSWRSSEVLRTNRIAESEMIKTSEMVVLDASTPESLPSMVVGLDKSNRGGLMSGAKRYEPWGVDACKKVLDSALDGIQPCEETPAILVIDCNATTGEMMEAFFIKKLSFTQLPMYYYGVCAGQDVLDQIMATRVSRLAAQAHCSTMPS